MPGMSNTKPPQSLSSLLTLLLFSLTLGGSAGVIAAPGVTATIRPLQFIAQAVLGDHGTARAVMNAQDSPHHFNLSPGDRLALAEADLILWIGPELETQLEDFLVRPEQARKSLRASTLDAVTLHRLESGETDPHLWLDPLNARAIAEILADRLAQADPGNGDAYRHNLTAFTDSLAALREEVQAMLAGLHDVPFLVYHDAYRYFEARFGLSHALALVDNPEVQPGMRELLLRRQQIEALGARCLLLEPEASDDLVTTLTGAGEGLHVETVDVLGFPVTPGADAYRRLIAGIAAQFRDCLQAGA